MGVQWRAAHIAQHTVIMIPALRIENLSKIYGNGFEALKGIDLDVEKGEVLSVIGASGSGKSTLLYCINGLERIEQGEVTVDGVSVHDRRTDINKLRQKIEPDPARPVSLRLIIFQIKVTV